MMAHTEVACSNDRQASRNLDTLLDPYAHGDLLSINEFALKPLLVWMNVYDSQPVNNTSGPVSFTRKT